MLVRKMLAGYFASWALILWVSFPYIGIGGASWHAAADYLSWAWVIALYAVPGTFLYGILISSLLEMAARKLRATGPGEWLVSGILHVVMGLLSGWFLKSSLFSIMGGTAAVLFFLSDKLILRYLPRLRRRARISLLAAPVLLLGMTAGTLYVVSPPKPPFTAADAVKFATSGSGTTIEWFPKEAGIRKLQMEGYDVEQETKAEETADKERYLVYFTERWRKGEEAGEYRMIYEVTRGSMGAKGGGGEVPPYRRSG